MGSGFWEGWRTRAASAKGVVFDYGGVIARAPGPDWPLYAQSAAMGLSRAALDAGFARYRRAYDLGEMTDAEMFGRIFSENGLALSAADAARLVDVEERGWTTLVPETLELMRALKADGRKVGILTNMHADFHRRRFAPVAAEHVALADAVAVSGLEGSGKPDRPIYDLMAARMGLPARDLLFLDDNEANVEGARAAGWQAERFLLPF